MRIHSLFTFLLALVFIFLASPSVSARWQVIDKALPDLDVDEFLMTQSVVPDAEEGIFSFKASLIPDANEDEWRERRLLADFDEDVYLTERIIPDFDDEFFRRSYWRPLVLQRLLP